MFWKNLQTELTAKKMWEFTDKIKEEIWEEGESDDEVREDYKNNKTHPDGSPIKYGWETIADPIFKAFEEVQREHTFDYLSTSYIQLKFAYDFWKQYEAEWNKKYRPTIV